MTNRFLIILASLALLSACFAQTVDVSLRLLFSLTRMDEEERETDGSITFSALVAIALLNHMNNGGLPVTRTRPYTCDVNFNFQLQDTVSDFTVALEHLLDLSNMDIIIGPSRSTTCIPVSFVTSTLEIPVLSPMCTSPDLDDSEAHRFFSRTIPSDDATAKAMVRFLEALPQSPREPENLPNGIAALRVYTRVVVLYQEDTYGSRYKDALFENSDIDGLQEPIDFTFIPFKPGNLPSLTAALDDAKATGLNIFVGILFNENLRAFVAEAIKRGLMGEGRLWVFTDALGTAADAFDTLFRSEEDNKLLKAVNNSFVVQATGRTLNDDNLEIFLDQLFTEEAGYDLEQLEELLLEAGAATDELEAADFSEVISSFTDPNVRERINDFAFFAYDAILAVREYIETFPECQGGFNGNDFMQVITGEGFSFTGITGLVQFDPETGSRTEASSAMKAFNIKFLEQEGELNFVPHDVTVGTLASDTWVIEDVIEFAGGLKNAPLVADPPEKVNRNEIGGNVQGLVYTLGVICMIAVVFLFVFIYFTSHKQVIEAAQPLFLMIMLFGVVLSTTAVFVIPHDALETEEVASQSQTFRCNAPFYFISLGVTISYGSLLFKLKRVVSVANMSPDLRSKQSTSRLASMRGFFIVIAINLAIILLCYTLNPLELKQRIVESDEFGQPIETFDVCLPKGGVVDSIYLIFFLFHIGFYAYGFYLIFQVRNFTTDFQEGRWITFSIVSQFQLFLLGIPVVIAIGAENPDIRFLVLSMLIILSNVVLVCLIFGPKVLRVMSGDDNVVLYKESKIGGNRALKSNNNETRFSSVGPGGEEVRQSLFQTMATDEFGDELVDEPEVDKEYHSV